MRGASKNKHSVTITSKNNTSVTSKAHQAVSPKKYEHEDYAGGFKRDRYENHLFTKKLKSGKSLGDLKEKFLHAHYY
jgi:hypothetical protein